MQRKKMSATTENKLKILIADDDTPTRILLKAAVSPWGYEIVEAKDGEEAWHILQQEDAPRLLILDWLMPKMDGVAVCEKSKKELSYHPYIILLTQMSGTNNLIKGLEAGADEFLSKPFNMAELRSRLSIGSRIIQHDLEMTKQNQILEAYVDKVNSLSHSLMSLAQETEEILKQEIHKAAKENLNLLDSRIKKIISTIKSFPRSAKDKNSL